MLAEVKRGLLSGVIPSMAGVLLAAVALTGCLADSDDEPKRITGAPKQVADVIARLERATRRRDFPVLCDQLFTPSARARAGGKDCVALLRETAKDVRRARIRLLDVRIEGDRATARVRTTAEGQTAVEETINLVRRRGRYRISALAS
jgi:hypothetical protein